MEHKARSRWGNGVYDSTLALIKLRGLVNKIQEKVEIPNDDVNYFVSGQYSRDAYEVVKLVEELDEFLTKNAEMEKLPEWWRTDPYA